MNNEVEVFVSEYCGYCTAAKRFLEQRGITYKIVDVTYDDTLRQEMVRRAEGRRTVPQIFIGGQPVGGYTDIVELERRGELADLLASA